MTQHGAARFVINPFPFLVTLKLGFISICSGEKKDVCCAMLLLSAVELLTADDDDEDDKNTF